MTTEFKVRKWLLVTLIIVGAAGLGYTGWYYNYQKSPASSQTSPTLALSITTSPSGIVTSSPTASTGTNQGTTGGSGQTNNNNGTATPEVETKTWEGPIDKIHSDSCMPQISFQYPSNIFAGVIGHSASSLAGGVWVGKTEDYLNDMDINIAPKSATIYQTTVSCPEGDMNSIYQNIKSYTATSEAKNMTVNGYPALQFNANYPIGTWTETLVQNPSTKFVASIILKDVNDPQLVDPYNIILNSFQFK
ncbi:MAG: hypothetical protein AAB785_00550 [Patescibacteria group bacterium]